MTGIKKKCEVLVVGGGVAGIAAAVSSAQQGAYTILIEKNNFPGGTAVTGLHRFICGLYLNGLDKPKDTINKGMTSEICFRLNKIAPEKTVIKMGRVYVLPCSSKNIISVLRSISDKQCRLDISYNTSAVSVLKDKNKIIAVTVCDHKKKFDIIPRMVVDCSGDGIIIQLSKVPYQAASADKQQFAGFTFFVKGLQNVDGLTPIKVPYYLSRAAKEKKIPFYLKYTTFIPGDNEDEGYCKLSIPPAKDKENNQIAKNNALLVHKYLSEVLPVFKYSAIIGMSGIGMSGKVLNREGPRLYGEYILNKKDVLKAHKFSDGIVKNAWPIELWDQKKGPTYKYVNFGDYYEIPARCIKSAAIANCYCAGRCISVSREALGSTRVIGTCISLGEQAGSLAALKAQTVL